VGFNVRDLSNGCSRQLARVERMADHLFSAGKYSFSAAGFTFAKNALLNFKNGGVVFVDEVGPLELNNKGYADCLNALIQSDISRLYVAMRNYCAKEFWVKFLFLNMNRISNVRQIDVPDDPLGLA
jgi:nucleoside-triphosphatase THEP1